MVHEDPRGYARVCEGMRGYARVCEGMRGYARVCEGMRGYARVCEGMPGYLLNDFSLLCSGSILARVFSFYCSPCKGIQ
jgi:hypothetical protein